MAIVICPECEQKVSSSARKCPHCGIGIGLFYRVMHLQEEQARFTTPTITRLEPGERVGFALMMMLIGGACAFIPLIGWLVAIAAVIAAVGMVTIRPDDMAKVEGECPHCNMPVSSTFATKTFNCSNCRNTVVFKQGHFLTVKAATDPGYVLPDITRQIKAALRGKRAGFLTFFIWLVAALIFLLLLSFLMEPTSFKAR